MFNPSPPSRILHQELAKVPGFLPAQEAFHSSNLTSRFFFISVSFSRIALLLYLCIVFKNRFCVLLSRSTQELLYQITQPLSSLFFDFVSIT